MLMRAVRMPHFERCSALQAEGLEKAVNIRVDREGVRTMFQVVDGAWVDVSDEMLPPSLLVAQEAGTSTYWRFDRMVAAHE